MEKRICVLTGGCGGMGHAISLRLGKDHTMLLADISAERLDAEKAALSKLGIEAETLVVDVGDRAQVDALAERASGLGVVDTVLHAAGLLLRQLAVVVRVPLGHTQLFHLAVSKGDGRRTGPERQGSKTCRTATRHR